MSIGTNQVAPETSRSEISSGNNSEKPTKEVSKWSFLSPFTRKHITEVEVFLLGMALILGSQNNAWNGAYAGGFGVVMFNIFFVGSGYLCLSLCLAEMSSALPFSGGIYGFVRAASGPYYGYVVACMEVLFNIVYISALVTPLANLPASIGATPKSFTPVFIFLIYFTVFIVCSFGGKIFWTTNAIFGVACIVLMIVYLIGALGHVGSHSDFDKYCPSMVFTAWNAFNARQGIAHQFLGIHYLPLNSDYVKNPKVEIPRIIMLTMGLLLLNAFFLSFAVCAQPPGIDQLPSENYPLTSGYTAIFHIPKDHATWLSFPGMFAAIFGFIYSYAKQLYSISKSGLLPKVFSYRIPILHTPINALSFGIMICFALTLWCHDDSNKIATLKNISSLSIQLVFVNAFIGYILFRMKYTNIQKTFISPLGIYGAIWGIINYSEGCIAIIFFHGKDYIPIVTVLIFWVMITLAYVFYISKIQNFSEEEREVLFKAYVINANRQSRSKVNKKSKIAPSAGTHGGSAAAVGDSHQNSRGPSSAGKFGSGLSIVSSTSAPRSSNQNNGLSNHEENHGRNGVQLAEVVHREQSHLTLLNSNDISNDIESQRQLQNDQLKEDQVQSSELVVSSSTAPQFHPRSVQQQEQEEVDELAEQDGGLSQSSKNVVDLLSNTLKAISRSFLQSSDAEEYRELAVLQEGGELIPGTTNQDGTPQDTAEQPNLSHNP